MTSIQLLQSTAINLAAAAAGAYSRRYDGYPDVPRDRCEEMVRELQTGKVGQLALSEDQVRTHRNTLKEQNERIAIEAARDRARDLYDFFSAAYPALVTVEPLVTLSFEDYVFLTKAETLKP